MLAVLRVFDENTAVAAPDRPPWPRLTHLPPLLPPMQMPGDLTSTAEYRWTIATLRSRRSSHAARNLINGHSCGPWFQLAARRPATAPFPSNGILSEHCKNQLRKTGSWESIFSEIDVRGPQDYQVKGHGMSSSRLASSFKQLPVSFVNTASCACPCSLTVTLPQDSLCRI